MLTAIIVVVVLAAVAFVYAVIRYKVLTDEPLRRESTRVNLDEYETFWHK